MSPHEDHAGSRPWLDEVDRAGPHRSGRRFRARSSLTSVSTEKGEIVAFDARNFSMSDAVFVDPFLRVRLEDEVLPEEDFQIGLKSQQRQKRRKDDKHPDLTDPVLVILLERPEYPFMMLDVVEPER